MHGTKANRVQWAPRFSNPFPYPNRNPLTLTLTLTLNPKRAYHPNPIHAWTSDLRSNPDKMAASSHRSIFTNFKTLAATLTPTLT